MDWTEDELAIFGHWSDYFPLRHEALHEGVHIFLVNDF